MQYDPYQTYEWRKSWLILIQEASTEISTLALWPLGLLYLRLNRINWLALWLVWFVVGLIIVAYIGLRVFDWAAEKYTLHPIRRGGRIMGARLTMRDTQPFLRTRQSSIPNMARVQHVSWRRDTFLEQNLNVGTVTIHAAGLGRVELAGLDNPDKVARILRQAARWQTE